MSISCAWTAAGCPHEGELHRRVTAHESRFRNWKHFKFSFASRVGNQFSIFEFNTHDTIGIDLITAHVFAQLRRVDCDQFIRRRNKLVPTILARDTSYYLTQDLAVVGVRHHSHAVAFISTDDQLRTKSLVRTAMTEIKCVPVFLDEEAEPYVVDKCFGHRVNGFLIEHLVRFAGQRKLRLNPKLREIRGSGPQTGSRHFRIDMYLAGHNSTVLFVTGSGLLTPIFRQRV